MFFKVAGKESGRCRKRPVPKVAGDESGGEESVALKSRGRKYTVQYYRISWFFNFVQLA